VFALGDLIALDDFVGLDLIAGLSIDLAIFDPVSRVLIELVEADLLSLRSRREKCDRTRDQRQFEIALPICPTRALLSDRVHVVAARSAANG
jgi:hypothetical protein